MRILHVLNTGKFSGAENVACQIINMFREEQDYEMAYCSYDGEISKALEVRNIDFIPISKMCKAEIKRVIQRYKPDIIHAHDMRAGYTVVKACGEIPVISHIHNNAFDSRGISLKSIAYCMAARKAKKIIWVSKSAFKGYVFHKLFRNKSIILYNVLDKDEVDNRISQDTSNYDFDVVFIGRLTYPKNPQRLLHIIRLACNKSPELKVAIVGTGELDNEIKKLCMSLELCNNVTFFGFVNNPLKILHDSKVMIMTSRWEGTPMVALEAIALGVPIISTPTDGLNELVQNGVNGWLTDNDNEFADYINKIVSDSLIQKRMSANQIAFSEKVNNINDYKAVLTKLYMKYGCKKRKN